MHVHINNEVVVQWVGMYFSSADPRPVTATTVTLPVSASVRSTVPV